MKPFLVCTAHYVYATLQPTHECVAELQRKIWRSDTYTHYNMPPDIITMDLGEVGYKFVCKRSVIRFISSVPPLLPADPHSCSFTSDPLKYITRSRIDESTSNLVRHANKCNHPASTDTCTPASSFNVGQFQYLVVAWSSCHARPHSIIEDEELGEIFTMLDPTIKIHSHQTVSHDISDVYKQLRTVIAHHLQSVKHRLHLTLDGWTSPNVFSFLGITVRYLENGSLCGFVLDFVKYVDIFYLVLSP